MADCPKKNTKCKVEISFADAVEIFKHDIITLKAHILVQRRQVNAHLEMKASLTEYDLMIQVDFAKSYKNEQQDAVERGDLVNQCFKILAACYYSVCPNNAKINNGNIINQEF